MPSAPEVKGEDFPWVWLWVGLGPRNPFWVHAYKTHQTKSKLKKEKQKQIKSILTMRIMNP